jgi:hypothetical protein
VTERHTAIDYAHALEHIADAMFPQATKIVLVQDNLNTHKSASLYQTLAPANGRRPTERFEWRRTQKHESWLDMGRERARDGRRRKPNQALPAESPAVRADSSSIHLRKDRGRMSVHALSIYARTVFLSPSTPSTTDQPPGMPFQRGQMEYCSS